MISLLYFVAKVVSLTLSAVTTCMLVRALLPLFADVEENRFYALLCVVTEPFIAPIRFLLVKFNLLQDSPIDWSFSITYLLIVIVQTVLPTI